MSPDLVEVTVNNSMLRWYRSRGYEIPTHEVQLWATIDGRRVKNGRERRVARGTVIHVKRDDLMPNSNVPVSFQCETCGETFTTIWRGQRIKMSLNCVSCQAKKGFKGGCHSYWVEKLIAEDPGAGCDLSGERDKRFLVLHHLLSRRLGGQDEPSNYVVLSANFHMAFHVWMGGTNVPCRPEDYLEFKRREEAGLRPIRRE